MASVECLGRPSAAESRQRRAMYLGLLAAGKSAVEAAREARIGPWVALEIRDSPDCDAIMAALRADAAAEQGQQAA